MKRSWLLQDLKPFFLKWIQDLKDAGVIGTALLNATINRLSGVAQHVERDPDYAGLLAALAAASSGDTVDLPTGTITGAVTVPAGVTVRGRGGSIIAGTVTLGDGATLDGVTVAVTGDSASALVGVLGPTTGTGYLHKCTITVTNAGGDAYGVAAQGGDLYCLWSQINGTTGQVME
jgi:hypothetical protein